MNKLIKRKHFSFGRDDFKAFIRRYDEDGNGYVSRKELTRMLTLDKNLYKGLNPTLKNSFRDVYKKDFYNSVGQ